MFNFDELSFQHNIGLKLEYILQMKTVYFFLKFRLILLDRIIYLVTIHVGDKTKYLLANAINDLKCGLQWTN